MPDGVRLDDGLSEDDAIAIALWNNVAFQEVLAELGFSRADLVDAGLLPNPVFSVLFPLGPKQLEFTLKFPLEVLWLRPRRINVAQLDAERVAEQLVQRGLDLVRDARFAWTDAVFAAERSRLAAENAALSDRIEALAQTRLRAGDISELEAINTRMSALLTRDEVLRCMRDDDLAETRMRNVLGLTGDPAPIVLGDLPSPTPPTDPLASLVDAALAARPDARAAELGIESASQRVGLARWQFIALTAALDANAKGSNGFEIGPGIDIPIPLFNRNQGGVARAKAELYRSIRQYAAVRDRIQTEVAEASIRLNAAAAQVVLWNDRALPEMEAAVHRAEQAYAAGDVSLFLLLQTSAQQLAIRVRHLELRAEAARARAEFERSLGQRLS
jgi:cobalt-zinc-cadmium efflux system outer membrane protein